MISTCKVESGDGEHVSDGPAEDAGTAEDLSEAIDSILKPDIKENMKFADNAKTVQAISRTCWEHVKVYVFEDKKNYNKLKYIRKGLISP